MTPYSTVLIGMAWLTGVPGAALFLVDLIGPATDRARLGVGLVAVAFMLAAAGNGLADNRTATGLCAFLAFIGAAWFLAMPNTSPRGGRR